MQDIHDTLIRLPELLICAAGDNATSRSDVAPLHYGRHCSVAFMLEVGSRCYHIDVDRGRLLPVVVGPLKMRSWSFAIRASERSFRKFWSDNPRPGFNDIFAMTSYGHARIDGDIGALLKDLRFIKTLIALPRGRLADSKMTDTDEATP